MKKIILALVILLFPIPVITVNADTEFLREQIKQSYYLAVQSCKNLKIDENHDQYHVCVVTGLQRILPDALDEKL